MAVLVDSTDVGSPTMQSPSDGTTPSPPFKPFTKAERIQQLNEIDKSITQLLKSAGLAIKTLTDCHATSETTAQLAQDGSRTFVDATNVYLKELHSVDVRLKRQICGLRENHIIRVDKDTAADIEEVSSGEFKPDPEKVTLDIGWLKSRSGKVGRDMEAELWGKSRSFLETLQNQTQEQGKPENGDQDQVMND